jgi:hypothetical protein
MLGRETWVGLVLVVVSVLVFEGEGGDACTS